MKMLNITIAIILATTSGVAISSCQTQAEKDFSAETKIGTLLPGMHVDVKDGIATINGVLDSEAAIDSVKKVVRLVKDVHSVVDKCCISMTTNPNANKPDVRLIEQSASILKEYPGVNASVKNGVIELNGEIKIGDWLTLKPKLYAIEAKKINNNNLIIK